MNVGEGKDDEALARKYAALCDVFVMDAFGTAHRAQASTHGAIRFAKVACGGPLLMAELDALAKALHAPARPLVAIVAGSKVSTKLELLSNLVSKVDQLIVGGGIANTFIAAMGHGVGKSLVEPDLLDTAKKIMADAGNVAWDMGSYQWLLQGKDFPTIHPSLQRQAVLNMAYGLYEVVPDRIYQVRGFDLANMTIVEGDTEVASQILLAASIRHSQLLSDFLRDVYMVDLQKLEKTLSHHQWDAFIAECEHRDAAVASWAPSTRDKLFQVVVRILAEAKYLDSTRRLGLTPPMLHPQTRNYLKKLGDRATLSVMEAH